MTIGESLRGARHYRGFSQEGLAAIAKTSAQHISEWETERRPASLRSIRKLAVALRVPLYILFKHAEKDIPWPVREENGSVNGSNN